MMLPRKWAPGSIFAYTGLEGQNSYSKSVVGTIAEEGLGITFHLQVRKHLRFQLNDVKDVNYNVVSSDWIEAELTSRDKKKGIVSVYFAAESTVVGSAPCFAEPFINTESKEIPYIEDGAYIFYNGEAYLAFMLVKEKEEYRYAVAISKTSKEEAITLAQKGLTMDIQELRKVKENYYRALSEVDGLDERRHETMMKCFSVMKTQVHTPEGIFKGRFTTPDRVPHRNVWLWDSVFHAIGNKYIDVELAKDSILAVFDMQQDDGFIPHEASPYKHSKITQPPVLAYGVLHMYEYTKDTEFVEKSYEALDKYLKWNMKHRDRNQNLLFEWVANRGDESGMDNSPRFDMEVPLDSVDFSCFMAKEAKSMATLAGVLSKSEEVNYWNELFEKIKSQINTYLWDKEDKFYYDRNLDEDKLEPIKAVSSFLPLFAGVCEEEHAKALVEHLLNPEEFYTPYLIPSIAKDDATFGTDMWRGPVWINTNYMIICGLEDYGYIELANEIREKTLDMITKQYFKDGIVYEFYDPLGEREPRELNRKGPAIEPYDYRIRFQSIRDFGWSCTLYPAMIMDQYVK